MPESIDHPGKVTVRIGGQVCILRFNGAGRAMVPFFQSVYREFLVNDQESSNRLDVCPLPKTGRELFGQIRNTAQNPETENDHLLTWEQLTHWSWTNRCLVGDVPFPAGTIGVLFINGLLVYLPSTGCARIFLPQRDRHPFRSLYRLFWIYFSQVLGEQGACFLHAAGIEKNGEGFVFIGGTGTGKSTLARLAGNGSALGDDAPVIANRGELPRIYASPYHQMGPEYSFRKSQIFKGVPVRSLYFLIRDDRTFVEPVFRTDAVAMIMARYIHFFFLISPEARIKAFDLFYYTCHKFPIYCLHYAINTNIWKIIPPNYK